MAVRYTVSTGITAHAGGGQGSATALTSQYNDITVCATAGDSVVLPALVIGQSIWVHNSGLNAADVYPPATIIDGGTVSAAVRIQPGHTVCFSPIDASNYKSDNPATGAVTQITSVTTGVTLDALKGIITTVASTANASGAVPDIFTVTNRYCRSGSHVEAYILDHIGTGNPDAFVDNITNGSFDIQVSSKSAAALNNVHKIGFEIKN